MTRPSFRSQRRKPRWAVTAVVAGTLVGAWVAGLFFFASDIPREVTSPDEHTDAIVVLTGGSGRLGMGLKLLSEKKAEKLFVSGVYRGLDVRRLLETSQRSPTEMACCIGIGYAVDTIGNATETAAWMRENAFTSLRLVTSNYHMPRSLLEFREALPDVRLVPHPVFPEHVKRERWWAWPGTTTLIVGEYNKLLLAWLRHRLTIVTGPILIDPLEIDEDAGNHTLKDAPREGS